MARRSPRPQTLRDIRVGAYRVAIWRAAERVFAERGFGAPVEQIAKAAGVSVGTIYRTYPGRKRQIYQTIQAERGNELMEFSQERGLAAFERTGDVLEAILAGVEALVEYFIGHPNYLRITLSEEKAWTSSRRRSTKQNEMWQRGMSRSEEGIRAGIAAGLLVDDAPEVMARTMVAMQQAHLGYWLESGERAPVSEVVACLRRQFLRAFCPPDVATARLERGPTSSRKRDRAADG